MSKPGYIVIVSPSYGGAEKRFFDIFTGMRRSARPVHFVAPSGLVARLQKDHPERGDIFDAMIPVPMPEWSRFGFIRASNAAPDPAARLAFPLPAQLPVAVAPRARRSHVDVGGRLHDGASAVLEEAGRRAALGLVSFRAQDRRAEPGDLQGQPA
jgi:hypothetical protein